MTDQIEDANFKAALRTINFNTSNFQILTFPIAITFLLGISVLLGTLITIQSADYDITSRILAIISLLDLVFIVLLFIAYWTYIRNIGKYIMGRIFPIVVQ